MCGSDSSFVRETKSSYEEYKSYDDGSVSGAISAAFNLVNILPCTVIWNFFMLPAEAVDSGNGGVAMVCAGCCGCLALLPIALVFVACLPFGIISCIGAAVYGGIRSLIRSCKEPN